MWFQALFLIPEKSRTFIDQEETFGTAQHEPAGPSASWPEAESVFQTLPKRDTRPPHCISREVIQEVTVMSIRHIRWEAEAGPGALAESRAVGSSPGSPRRRPQPRHQAARKTTMLRAASIYGAITMHLALDSTRLLTGPSCDLGQAPALPASRGEVFL